VADRQVRFYASPAPGPQDLVVVSMDGKGVVMPAEAFRPGHRARQAVYPPGQGERSRKRMAEVGTVYHATPIPCTAGDDDLPTRS